MENKERVRRFENKETITSIANSAGVSRAAIIQTLKRAGVYVKGKHGRPSVREVGVKDYSVPTYDIKEDKPWGLRTEKDIVQPRVVISDNEQVEVLNADEGICRVLGGEVKATYFDTAPAKEILLYTNVWMSVKGCKVFDRGRRGLETFKTFAALCAAYR